MYFLPSGIRSAFEHDPRRRGGDRHDRGDRRRNVRRGLPDDQAEHPHALRQRRRRHSRIAANEKHECLNHEKLEKKKCVILVSFHLL